MQVSNEDAEIVVKHEDFTEVIIFLAVLDVLLPVDYIDWIPTCS